MLENEEFKVDTNDFKIDNACLLEKINDVEMGQQNLSDEISQVKIDLSNQLREMKSMLMDAMHTLSRAFKMNCEGTLNLREEMSDYAGTFGPDPLRSF